MSQSPTSVGILGSCLTRDCFNSKFNPDYKRWFAPGVSANQTSLISLMSDPIDAEWSPLGKMSDYDRWNVNDDLSKGFLPAITAAAPDLLLIDLFADIHFGVVQVDGGPMLTDNRWKVQKTDWYAERSAAGALRVIDIFDHHDEFMELWRDAVRRLALFLARNLPDTTLVVNRGRNTSTLLRPGKPRAVDIQEHTGIKALDVERANELWSLLDDELAEALGARQIDLTDVEYPSMSDHPWGPNYVHYTPDYYRRFLGELHSLQLGMTLSTRGVAQLDAVFAAVSDERALHQQRLAELTEELDRRTAANRRLRRKVKELEQEASGGLTDRVQHRLRRLTSRDRTRASAPD